MPGKLKLPATPPSEGVHCLADWMLGVKLRQLSETRIEQARDAVGEIVLDRVIAGELVPGQILGEQIAALTGGRVRPKQFWRPTGRRWSERPGWDARNPELR